MNSYRISIHTHSFCISYYLSVKNRPFLVNALRTQCKDLQLQRCSRNMQNALRRRCRYIRNSLQRRALGYSARRTLELGDPRVRWSSEKNIKRRLRSSYVVWIHWNRSAVLFCSRGNMSTTAELQQYNLRSLIFSSYSNLF